MTRFQRLDFARQLKRRDAKTMRRTEVDTFASLKYAQIRTISESLCAVTVYIVFTHMAYAISKLCDVIAHWLLMCATRWRVPCLFGFVSSVSNIRFSVLVAVRASKATLSKLVVEFHLVRKMSHSPVK